ncbi:MAG: arsenate reductase ArsC [Terriglobia bacterium]|jgi:arsenate reductase
MVKVLFVCYGNSCRSQMAEALANDRGAGKVRAFSAGSNPLGVISQGTREVLREKGITLEGHSSKGLQDVPVSEMDVVVEMGYGVTCAVPADFKGRLIQWNIPDPFGLDWDHFREVRDLIENEVRTLLADLEGDSGNRKLETGNSKMETGKCTPPCTDASGG